MESTGWPAPGKINWFLHVTGRRSDGYHLLQTVFQFISLGDELAFRVLDSPEVRLARPLPGIPAEQDMTVRAARLLKAEAGAASGVEISVSKRLPMGGGLGGGSSDAATTLVALNALWGCGLSVDRLAALGLRLGADVPVFVRGDAAWAEGVGELLEPLELSEPWLLVLVPQCQVPTGEIFSAPELNRQAPPITIRNFLSGQGINVCEPVVRSRYRPVAEALDWLSRFAAAKMSGTGSSVFAAFESERAARTVCGQLPPGWHGYVVRTMNQSPLRTRLAQYN